MSLPETVAVLGLGLMGGSLTIDLSAAGVRVLGFDSRAGVSREALAAGSVAAELDMNLEGIGEADLVVIATPVDAAVDLLARLEPMLRPGAAVTDVGSTKSMVVAAAEKAGLGEVFVGSHPLAGDHRSGWSAARAGLYRDAQIYISPTSATSEGCLRKVESFWSSLGARTTRMEADHHDQLMAWVSHLPQVVSSAVAAALADAGCEPLQLGPGGRDVTRLAGSSPEMWTAIALSNATPLLHSLGEVRRRLEAFQSMLVANDPDGIRSFFKEGNDWTRQP